MKNKKFNYSKNTTDIFYEKIYPLFPKEFLFGNDYEEFAKLVSSTFVLNSQQWEYILEHWEDKENILCYDDDAKTKDFDLFEQMGIGLRPDLSFLNIKK